MNIKKMSTTNLWYQHDELYLDRVAIVKGLELKGLSDIEIWQHSEVRVLTVLLADIYQEIRRREKRGQFVTNVLMKIVTFIHKE